MEAYKLRKIIENQKIDVQILFDQVNIENETLRQSLKKRKEMTIQHNDTQYKEETVEELFDEEGLSESDTK